ncbi:MAG: hypothetical protein HY724_05620 [Candidatus Rokubacteria bacterium]|nr:hypothetical protein [Candidatus Rokubacteria bacterium]
MVLPETNLYQVKEVPTEQVPANLFCAKSDLHWERPQIGVEENYAMDCCLKRLAPRGRVPTYWPRKQVNADSPGNPPTKQGKLSTRIKVCLYVYRLIRKVGVLNLKRKARKGPSALDIEVPEQTRVVYGNHALDSNPRSIIPWPFNINDVGNPDPLFSRFRNYCQRVCAVSNNGFFLQCDPSPDKLTKHLGVGFPEVQLSASIT